MAKIAPAKSSRVGMVVVFVAIIFLMMSSQLASEVSEFDDTLPQLKFARRLLQNYPASDPPPLPPYSKALNDEKP
ncbi:hypothetical protein Pint_11698 [Pistacia integerrima]|uniref:Uncharacterized protein n=1 Tax=Pistacia integerrima TaxID=434235 RepID=A0ACC0XGC7_9ROSI|nr:hypothetical protein Pint_11698 [Pistacia integerrima]